MKIKLTPDQRMFISIFDFDKKLTNVVGESNIYSGSFYYTNNIAEDGHEIFNDIGNEPITKEFLEEQGWKLNYEEKENLNPRLWIKNKLEILKNWKVFRKNNITMDWGVMLSGYNHFIITGSVSPLFDGQLFKKSDYFQLMKFLNI